MLVQMQVSPELMVSAVVAVVDPHATTVVQILSMLVPQVVVAVTVLSLLNTCRSFI
jgi:hypothetical protein